MQIILKLNLIQDTINNKDRENYSINDAMNKKEKLFILRSNCIVYVFTHLNLLIH